MKAFVKRAVTGGAGALLLGASLALSSFAVSVARVAPAKRAGPAAKACNTSNYCLTESNNGSGGGVSGISPDYYGVSGTSTDSFGVWGYSSDSNAIEGKTEATNGSSGVAGISTATSGTAQGVYGATNTGDGVYGVTNADAYAGVYGLSSTGGSGVVGQIGSSASEDGKAAVEALADGSYGNIFIGYDAGTKSSCVISDYAELSCTGSIDGPALHVRQPTSSGRHVLAYAPESASATIEDVGTARMYDGIANVQIGSDFSAVMDGKLYYVFLTPLGDTRGLYVSMKTPTGFQVRETERGRDSLEFDYRIVAHPLGAANDRLPLAPNTKGMPQATR